MGRNLATWDRDHRHADAIKRLRAEMAGVCSKLPAGDPARATCGGVLAPAA
jgi:hypothetical protein